MSGAVYIRVAAAELNAKDVMPSTRRKVNVSRKCATFGAATDAPGQSLVRGTVLVSEAQARSAGITRRRAGGCGHQCEIVVRILGEVTGTAVAYFQ